MSDASNGLRCRTVTRRCAASSGLRVSTPGRASIRMRMAERPRGQHVLEQSPTAHRPHVARRRRRRPRGCPSPRIPGRPPGREQLLPGIHGVTCQRQAEPTASAWIQRRSSSSEDVHGPGRCRCVRSTTSAGDPSRRHPSRPRTASARAQNEIPSPYARHRPRCQRTLVSRPSMYFSNSHPIRVLPTPASPSTSTSAGTRRSSTPWKSSLSIRISPVAAGERSLETIHPLDAADRRDHRLGAEQSGRIATCPLSSCSPTSAIRDRCR